MSVAVTGTKVNLEGLCLYTWVGVFCHLLASLVIAQLELVRGMSGLFWVMLVTLAMDLSR